MTTFEITQDEHLQFEIVIKATAQFEENPKVPGHAACEARGIVANLLNDAIKKLAEQGVEVEIIRHNAGHANALDSLGFRGYHFKTDKDLPESRPPSRKRRPGKN